MGKCPFPTAVHAALLVWYTSVALTSAADPGESGYSAQLAGLSSTSGHLSPSFRPDLPEYVLTVTEGGLHTVYLQFALDISKYPKRSWPRITVDGAPFTYTPLNQLFTVIEIEKSFGPVNKTVRVKVEDPSDRQGWFGNAFFARPHNEMEYVVRIVKVPEFRECVRATSMSVKDESGHAYTLMPPFDPWVAASRRKHHVVLPAELSSVTVQVDCPSIGDGFSQMYDNKVVPAGSSFKVDMSTILLKRVVVMCSYTNHDFLSSDFQRIYILDLDKHVEIDHAQTMEAQLMPLENFGYCETVPKDDHRLMRKTSEDDMSLVSVQGSYGFVCRVDTERALFVATFSSVMNATLTATLVGTPAGEHDIIMENARPVDLRMAHERQYFNLLVDAGDVAVNFPVLILRPAPCSSLECPALQATRPTDLKVAKEHMCSSEFCTLEDVPHCCVPRAACGAYPEACPAFQELRPDMAQVLCEGAECTAEDEEICCAWITTTTSTATSTTSSTRTTSTSSLTVSSTTPVTTTTASSTASRTSSTQTSSTHASTTEADPLTTLSVTTASTSTVSISTTTSPIRTSTISSSYTSSSTSSSVTYTGTETRTTTTSSSTSVSSTTSSSSSSTSTSMFCIESDVIWLPLDLLGAPPTIVADRRACQDRCFSNPRCRHWAFWLAGRHCHLQGEKATRSRFGFGFESGPPECLPSLTMASTSDLLTNNFKCVKEAFSWEPVLGTPGYYTGSTKENLQLCQSKCARFPGCARFVLDSMTGMCRLAGHAAKLLPAPQSWLSGPPRCGGGVSEEVPDLIMRKFQGTAALPQHPRVGIRGGVPQDVAAVGSGRRFSRAGALTAALVLVVFLPLLLVAGRRRSDAGSAARGGAPLHLAGAGRRQVNPYAGVASSRLLVLDGTE